MKDIRIVPATIVGALLYMGLSWVPILGPLIVGFATSWVRRGTAKESFNAGIFSGTLGFIGLMALLSNIGILSGAGFRVIITVLVLWIILLWNLIGILLCGIGGVFGSLIFSTHAFFEKRSNTRTPSRGDAKTFLICSNCGVGNLSTEKVCSSCGIDLDHES